MQEAGGRVQSIEKAVKILETLAAAEDPMPLRELARRTQLPKSTLHGIISTLRQTGLVEQSAQDGRYGLGLHLFELGCAASSSRSITSVCRPFLQNLANRAGETAFLAALDGNETLLLEVAEASNPLRVALAPGTRLPLHCTAQGKVFLAWNEALLRRQCRAGLTAYTPHTHITAEQLTADAAVTREQGCAIEDGEHRIGLRAVAAPVTDPMGEVRYAIGVVGMFRRIQSEEFTTATHLTQEAARSIAAALQRRM